MKLFDFIFAARPLLHLPVWTVYLISLEATTAPDIPIFNQDNLLTIIALTLMFAGAFYFNQIEDEESDRLNNKLGFLQRGWISPNQMLWAFRLVSIASLLITLFVSLWVTLILGCVLILSIIYSHPRVRLKDRPYGGLISNMLAHGFFVSVVLFPWFESTSYSFQPLLLGLYFSLTVGAIYIMTTIPDRVGDEATDKKTISVVFGQNRAIIIAAVMMAASVPIGWETSLESLGDLSGLSAGLIFLARLTESDRLVLLSAKLPLLLLTLWAGTAFPVYLLFIIALIIATRIYYHRRFDMTYPRLM